MATSNTIKNPLKTILPAAPVGDRRPTVIRPRDARDGMFLGWGPKL